MKRLMTASSPSKVLYDFYSLLRRHHELIWEMTRREFSDKYAGQAIGILWALGHPLVLMGIYVFVFNFVFKTRMGGNVALPLDYTAYLLSGLIPWMAFQDAMGKSATVIVNNANLVKQVVFPTEILPLKGVIASCVTQSIFFFLMMAYVLIRYKSLPLTYLLIPALFLAQAICMTGVSYIISSLSVYFRDIKDLLQVFCLANIYIMPIFYLPEMVPKIFKPVLYLNPFSYMIWCYQDVLYFGELRHPWAWLVFGIGAVTIFYTGYRVFMRLKVFFGNVL